MAVDDFIPDRRGGCSDPPCSKGRICAAHLGLVDPMLSADWSTADSADLPGDIRAGMDAIRSITIIPASSRFVHHPACHAVETGIEPNCNCGAVRTFTEP